MMLCPSGKNVCAVCQGDNAVCDLFSRICKVTKWQSCACYFVQVTKLRVMVCSGK